MGPDRVLGHRLRDRDLPAPDTSERHNVVILGGGLVGMTLAIGLARAGITSAVVDSLDPAAQTADGFDGRASAISTASWNLYTHLGLTEALEPLGCPIAKIAVTDGMKPGRIDFQPGPDDGTLGRMFANRDLRIAMYAAAAKEILAAAIPRIPLVPDWPEHHALEMALMTERSLWPAETVERLRPILAGRM